ncbi:hypothetical protein DMENIID0001_018340 [Sergentomyia squamirostris]
MWTVRETRFVYARVQMGMRVRRHGGLGLGKNTLTDLCRQYVCTKAQRLDSSCWWRHRHPTLEFSHFEKSRASTHPHLQWGLASSTTTALVHHSCTKQPSTLDRCWTTRFPTFNPLCVRLFGGKSVKLTEYIRKEEDGSGTPGGWTGGLSLKGKMCPGLGEGWLICISHTPRRHSRCEMRISHTLRGPNRHGLVIREKDAKAFVSPRRDVV